MEYPLFASELFVRDTLVNKTGCAVTEPMTIALQTSKPFFWFVLAETPLPAKLTIYGSLMLWTIFFFFCWCILPLSRMLSSFCQPGECSAQLLLLYSVSERDSSESQATFNNFPQMEIESFVHKPFGCNSLKNHLKIQVKRGHGTGMWWGSVCVYEWQREKEKDMISGLSDPVGEKEYWD